ncbi:hypothetical protein FS827_26515 [Agrobacterium vitis]|uniref:hypothetical protein n=1 Tax=Allorhizobium ampelinum TaxID=3025782 RepID=UPI001F3AD04F|nr:hypothetical protein [Allorhizobium ampelinum]MCF1464822.1 hypothetical protein [Allorhizobium ampelinum]
MTGFKKTIQPLIAGAIEAGLGQHRPSLLQRSPHPIQIRCQKAEYRLMQRDIETEDRALGLKIGCHRLVSHAIGFFIAPQPQEEFQHRIIEGPALLRHVER